MNDQVYEMLKNSTQLGVWPLVIAAVFAFYFIRTSFRTTAKVVGLFDYRKVIGTLCSLGVIGGFLLIGTAIGAANDHPFIGAGVAGGMGSVIMSAIVAINHFG